MIYLLQAVLESDLETSISLPNKSKTPPCRLVLVPAFQKWEQTMFLRELNILARSANPYKILIRCSGPDSSETWYIPCRDRETCCSLRRYSSPTPK